MTFAEEVKAFSPVVVFIDDGFKPVDFDQIDAADWADLRDVADKDEASWTHIRDDHFATLGSIMELKRGEQLANAWDLYVENPQKFGIFDSIFSKLAASQGTAISRLRDIIKFLKEELGLDVRCHPTIEGAQTDISLAKLIFLDFYLYARSTPSSAIDDVSRFRELFGSKVTEGKVKYNRFLFLISTQLPAADDIERFRKAATVKTAFFKPVPKNTLSKEWFADEFGKRLRRYEDLHRLESYLEVFSSQMMTVAEDLRADLESLELHDLAILDHMRLKAEQEDLGNYMSWIMSEALAARLRASAPVLAASKDVNDVQPSPFHGLLSPNQVLFSWFAEITFGQINPSLPQDKLQFGDVFTPVVPLPDPAVVVSWSLNETLTQTFAGDVLLPFEGQAAHFLVRDVNVSSGTEWNSEASDAAIGDYLIQLEPKIKSILGPQSHELMLVIAPACDLQRLKCNYEVLCVKGAIIKQTPNLFDLMDHKGALGKNEDSGSYRHLMKRTNGGKIDYVLVEWYPEKVASIPASSIQGQGFSRLARLNELFAHEIKEDALRNIGRVGVPVDPSFSFGLGATLVYTPKKKPPVEKDFLETELVSGLYSSGNANNRERIILSEEFIDKFSEYVRQLDPVNDPLLQDVIPKLQGAYAEMRKKAGEGIKLSKNQLQIGPFTIRYVPEFVRGTAEQGFCGVYFYPCGTIKDPPVQETE